MMKWFRKHNKQLLAVFASALLVVWLGGSALQRMFERNRFNEALGSAMGQTLTASENGSVRASFKSWKCSACPGTRHGPTIGSSSS